MEFHDSTPAVAATIAQTAGIDQKDSSWQLT